MIEMPEFKFALREDLEDRPEFLPTRSEPNATGWDVRCAEPDGIVLKPFEKYKIRLGFRMFAPEGYWMELKPRSSSFTKKHLHFLYGTIDENFENEMLAAFQYVPEMTYAPKYYQDSLDCYICDNYDAAESIGMNCKNIHIPRFKYFFEDVIYHDYAPIIEFGERIGQLIPVKRQEMIVAGISNEEYERLCAERGGQRGAGGFGSTGYK